MVSSALRTSDSTPTRRCIREAYQTITHWPLTLFPCSLSTKTPSGDSTGASTGTAGAIVNVSMVADGSPTNVWVAMSFPERAVFIPPVKLPRYPYPGTRAVDETSSCP
ncbi:hypothetical protein K466DRAFT_217781 [Polyporus arcularius HHB13444]|uniref:Uncharacterized protein n=1 Tax=Polyporus arcularius HHB13444 TaxID=1314778 RepID=A0A5C3PRZ7_9APHY|nr:hypothetical protein K466DRAFT_217781 [Polyporus arcularius HHB13444]